MICISCQRLCRSFGGDEECACFRGRPWGIDGYEILRRASFAGLVSLHRLFHVHHRALDDFDFTITSRKGHKVCLQRPEKIGFRDEISEKEVLVKSILFERVLCRKPILDYVAFIAFTDITVVGVA